MRRAALLGMLTILLGAVACASPLENAVVESEHDPEADFSAYQSFEWIAPSKFADPAVAERVRVAVGQELTRKGYSKAKGAEPDFLITAHGALKEDMQLVPVYYGGARGGAMVMRQRIYNQGTLIIDVRSPKLDRVVWRGSLTDVFASRDTAVSVIEQVVAKILTRFPPQ
jgi:hypothetical protein